VLEGLGSNLNPPSRRQERRVKKDVPTSGTSPVLPSAGGYRPVRNNPNLTALGNSRGLLIVGGKGKGIVGSLLLIKSGAEGGDTLKRVAANTFSFPRSFFLKRARLPFFLPQSLSSGIEGKK
jgi:hypothetical protein